MTVKELIVELSKMDQDKRVVVTQYDPSDWYFTSDIEIIEECEDYDEDSEYDDDGKLEVIVRLHLGMV
tara:strand:+ start:721 stop:924 length:204 start_codon:yes stop_codon:yes gene_type:complete